MRLVRLQAERAPGRPPDHLGKLDSDHRVHPDPRCHHELAWSPWLQQPADDLASHHPVVMPPRGPLNQLSAQALTPRCVAESKGTMVEDQRASSPRPVEALKKNLSHRKRLGRS